MINFLTRKIVSYFLAKNYIAENQVEWCEYVVAQKLCAVVLLPIMIGAGCLVAPLWQVIVLNIGVYYLRSRTNGFHAESIVGCLVFSSLCEAAALKAVAVFSAMPLWISVAIYGAALLTVFMLAPINNERIHYSEQEIAQIKVSIRVRLLIYSAVTIGLYFRASTASVCLIMAAAVVAILLVIAKLGFGVQ